MAADDVVAPDMPAPFGTTARSLDRAALTRDVAVAVTRQAQELGVPARYVAKVAMVAERVDFQSPFEFLVTAYFERERERRDALLALYARDPRQAIRELGSAFPSPRAEMILATFAYYDLNADRVRVNLERLPEGDAARVLVHEFWHALPDARSWREADSTAYRATGFWAQRQGPGSAAWEPIDTVDGLPYSTSLLNEAVATRMEIHYAGPLRFKRPDLDAVDGFLTRLTDAAGPSNLLHAYLGSEPTELLALARQHPTAMSDTDLVARR